MSTGTGGKPLQNSVYDDDAPLEIAGLDDDDLPGQADTVPGAPTATGIARDGRRIGPYKLHEELGRGAVGIVYRAHHTELRQDHAIKILQDEHARSHECVERFVREARAMARLGKHPNIVQVHAVGKEGGRPYFVMDLVEGETLERRILRGGPLPERQALELGRKVCLALHHAHGQKLVHRDVKPQNVLIDPMGEPHVADFGLVKDTSERNQDSRVGQAVGTPAYMAPEQAAGRAQVDARSDVFAAGALLYQALTGRRPFEGPTAQAVMLAVLHADPVPPRRRVPTLAPLTERAVLKALEKDPARRYQTARELADDLAKALTFAAPDPAEARPAEARGVPDDRPTIKAVRTNEFALAAWKWGVFGAGVLSPIGIVAGIIALFQLRFGAERQRETGSGLALGGLSIGTALTAAVVGIGLLVSHVAGSAEREAADKRRAQEVKSTIRRLADALDRIRDREGAYPKTKTTAELRKRLLQAGVLKGASFPVDREGRLIDPWERPFVYSAPGEANAESYDLHSAGPDGRDEGGNGDDVSNFDPRFSELWPRAERPEEKTARRLLDDALARDVGLRVPALERIVAEYPATRAADEACKLLNQLAAKAPPDPMADLAELQARLHPLENGERWGELVAACEAFLAGLPAPSDAARGAVMGWLANYRKELEASFAPARAQAAERLAAARGEAFSVGADPKAVERAIEEADKLLADAAARQKPALDKSLSSERAAHAPMIQEIRAAARLSAFRAAVRDRVWPALLRRDHEQALAALGRLRGELPDLEAAIDRERADIAEIVRIFALAVDGARQRIGSDESFKLRGTGWAGGRLEAADDGKLTFLLGVGMRREVSALALHGESLVRLVEVVPLPRSAAATAAETRRRTTGIALIWLADGEVKAAEIWIEKARALGEDVSRLRQKFE